MTLRSASSGRLIFMDRFFVGDSCCVFILDLSGWKQTRFLNFFKMNRATQPSSIILLPIAAPQWQKPTELGEGTACAARRTSAHPFKLRRVCAREDKKSRARLFHRPHGRVFCAVLQILCWAWPLACRRIQMLWRVRCACGKQQIYIKLIIFWGCPFGRLHFL